MRVSRRLLWSAVAVLAVIPLGILAFQAILRQTGNFHTVIAGELYRSAQLDPAQLKTYVHDYGIKTMLNLRGDSANSPWFSDEVKAAQELGVRHIDFGMSSARDLTPQRAMQLLALMKSAPKPLLIHCRTGADRTGLASVIYVSQVAGLDEETAEAQLTMEYGHFGIPLFSPTYAMDRSWENLEKLFGIEGS